MESWKGYEKSHGESASGLNGMLLWVGKSNETGVVADMRMV